MSNIIEHTKTVIPAESLFKQLEQEREVKGITQLDMAMALGITTRTYYNWIHSGTSQSNVKKIENVLSNWRIK